MFRPNDKSYLLNNAKLVISYLEYPLIHIDMVIYKFVYKLRSDLSN